MSIPCHQLKRVGLKCDLDRHDRLVGLFNTNFFGPVNLTKAILPHFRERKGGFIVYVSSQVGWQAEPGASSYCASKFALAGMLSAALFPTSDEGIF